MNDAPGHLIKKFFDRFREIPLDVWEGLAEIGEVVHFRGEEVLKEPGEKAHFLYFILEGSGGVILYTKNSFVCTDILHQGEFFGEFLSFLTQKPTPHELRSFEHSTMLRFRHKELYEYYDRSGYADEILKAAHLGLYIDKLTQQMNLLSLSAEEHYKMLMRERSYILKNVPQKYIASYLGITAQSLSRIRKHIN